MALNKFNLDDYDIFIFSDDIEKANKILAPLKLNSKNANDYVSDDESHILWMALSDVIICSNSTFSLFACYLNEIFEFNKCSKYIIPSIWKNSLPRDLEQKERIQTCSKFEVIDF